MGLLDDMAKANRDMHTKPDGWVTAKEYAGLACVGMSKSKRTLDGLAKGGTLETRQWQDPATGKFSTIYGEPV